MSGAWLVSYIALWALVLFQGVVIFVLLRQLGVIYLGTAQGVARDGLPVGERAPDFSVDDLERGRISLGELLGRPLLLVFGSPTCAPCRTLIPELNAFAREHARDLGVLFLSRGEIEAAHAFRREVDAQVPVAAHPDESLPEAYRARVTPFAFLIDGEGVIRAKGLTNNRSHLDMLLQVASRDDATHATNGRNGAQRQSAVEETKR